MPSAVISGFYTGAKAEQKTKQIQPSFQTTGMQNTHTHIPTGKYKRPTPDDEVSQKPVAGWKMGDFLFLVMHMA